MIKVIFIIQITVMCVYGNPYKSNPYPSDEPDGRVG